MVTPLNSLDSIGISLVLISVLRWTGFYFRPISLIGSVYKAITKILANRLSTVISNLVSNTQSAFVKDRKILDGPFILNEALAWCKRKKTQALIFKVDFAKAYNSVMWDFLQAYGFGSRWCSWIRGIFSSNMASILVNESPTAEFPILCGLKQGDPLAHLLFILVMESLHISVSIAVNDGVFKASGLKINVHKSQVLGVGVHPDIVNQGASTFGCTIMHTLFKYLGVTVGDQMSHHSAWRNIIQKVRTRLSKWKVKTLSIGGRLTLLKKKITWVAWDKVLASKKQGGLGVSSYYALNRALLLKWVWRFISQDGSLWSRIINAFYGSSIEDHDPKRSSCWSSILREVQTLALKSFDFFRISRFVWGMVLIPDSGVILGLRARNGAESQQWAELLSLLGTFTLSLSIDRWISDLNGEGSFRVKDFRSFLDDLFLPSSNMATRWVKCVLTEVNVFVWRARLERLPTRDNLAKRGVPIDSNLCPVCGSFPEDAHHLFFDCDLAINIFQKIYRWWNLSWVHVSSFVEWDTWFASIRLSSKLKSLLEGVLITYWWFIWSFRNRSIFEDPPSPEAFGAV
nr:RNA-directed DNA polymerase, eukaryota [Tanacetum cinerariifolium]